MLNTALSSTEQITIFRTLSIDVNNDKQIKQKMANFFLQTFQNYQIFLRHPASNNRNSSAFLLHTSKTFSNIELFSIFSQTSLGQIFATKIKTMLLKQSAVLFTSSQKIFVSEHLKYYTQINEY